MLLSIKKYLTEFLGTFFLVLTIGLAAGSGSAFAPIAIGSMLMAMVYMGKHISGAHYNPAITLAVLIQGKIDWKNGGIYWLCQLVAGILAAGVVGMLVQDADFTFLVSKQGHATEVQALLLEVLFSFALVLVFLHTTLSEKTEGNSYYGLAIGFMVVAGILVGNPLSDGVFNPAVGLGPNVLNGGIIEMWIFLVGPLLGGALAGFTFSFQDKEKK